jgi:hypothetical protein
MSIDVDVLSETYLSLKEYIPVKDQQEAADALMSTMVDYLNDKDLKDFAGSDPTLKKAFREYAGHIDEGDGEEDE